MSTFLLVLCTCCILALLIAGLLLRAIRYPRYEVRADPERFPDVRTHAEALDLADALLAQMSLREKLSQLSGDLRFLRFGFRYFVGLVTRFGVPHIYSGRNDRLGIPPLCFSDGPRGVNVGTGRTAFPVTMARGASWDPALEQRVGEAMGRELRAIGANYSGAVCVNLLRHPGWGRAQETYGEDPHHLGVMGVALTRGIQSQNVMACVKHFALNSIECSRFYVNVEVGERRLREVYLPHFERIIREGEVASVMSAYNRFRGEFCGHSHTLLTQILREEWGFQGFVTSDWLHGVREGLAGVKAGMDVEMPATQRYGRPLRQALRRGELTEAEVDESVRRILATRMRFALAEDTESYPASVIACEDHLALAREVAEKSAVLLKNEGVLPFDTRSLGRLAVIGRLAALENTGDEGSSDVRAPHVVTPLQGLRDHLSGQTEVVYETGRDLAQAARVAEQADAVVLVVGFTSDDEGEYFVLNPDAREGAWRPSFFGGGGDRKDIRLGAADRQMLERLVGVHPRTVVVVVAGSAVSTEGWGAAAPAILLPFYSGMEGGRALARILFGEVSPSGKLPFTIPADPADLPDFEPFGEQADYDSDHGYIRFEKGGLEVAHPFGFGLSYSRFECRNLVLDSPVLKVDGTLSLSVELHNLGDRAGAEVVQLYIGCVESRVERPPKLLRGFQKARLEPGSSRRIRFELPAHELAFYDEEVGDWEVELTTYTAFVGTSSASSDLLEVSFRVE
jgi:beta-glucosidase